MQGKKVLIVIVSIMDGMSSKNMGRYCLRSTTNRMVLEITKAQITVMINPTLRFLKSPNSDIPLTAEGSAKSTRHSCLQRRLKDLILKVSFEQRPKACLFSDRVGMLCL